MRYEYDDLGAFVEFSDSWTRKQIKNAWNGGNAEEYLALVRSKIVDCYLPVVDGDPIDAPDKLTVDNVDEMDIRLWQWFSATVPKALNDIMQLGEAAAASLWNMPETATAADQPTK